jgi:hypothetical protein
VLHNLVCVSKLRHNLLAFFAFNQTSCMTDQAINVTAGLSFRFYPLFSAIIYQPDPTGH